MRATSKQATSAKKIMLVEWSAAVDGEARLERLRRAGFKVIREGGPRSAPQILKRLRLDPPSAVVIDLDGQPMQGRDLGVAIRTGKSTRHLPLVFAGGDPQKVKRVAQTLPDAMYTSWPGIEAALKRAIEKGPANPIVPASNLAGYSGTPLPKKLGIKPSSSFALLSEPENFLEHLGELPPGVDFSRSIAGSTSVANWFVRSARDLASQIDSIAERGIAATSCRLWIAWAKRSSPLASDVTESTVRTSALAAGLVDYKVAALDGDWSGLLFAPRRT